MNSHITSLQTAPAAERESILVDMPPLLAEAGEWKELTALLIDLQFIEAKCFFGHSRRLITDYESASPPGGPAEGDRQTLLEWQQFARQEVNGFERFAPTLPQIVFQQAFNHSRGGSVARAAEAMLARGRAGSGPWLEHVNRPGQFRRSALLLTLEGHTAPITGVIALDANRAVSASKDHTVRVWNLETGECVKVLRGHSEEVHCLALGDKSQMFSAALDGTIRVWDTNTLADRVIQAFPVGHSPIGIAAVPSGRVCSWIAGSREQRTVRVWDANSGECLCTHESPERRVDFVDVLDGETAVGATSDGIAWCWSLQNGQLSKALGIRPGRITCVSHVGSRFVVFGSTGGAFWVHERDSGKAYSLPNAGGSIRCLAAAADACVLVGAADGKLRLWDLPGGKLLRKMEGHSAEVIGVAAANDTAVSIGTDSTLRIWDVHTGKCIVAQLGSGYGSLASASSGRALVSSSHVLQMWDTTSQTSDTPIEQHTDGIMRMIRTCDGRLISGGRDGELRVWDMRNGQCLATLRGHGNRRGKRVFALLVTPDGRLVSSGEDHQVLVWCLQRYQQIGSLSGHTEMVHELGWSHQGEIVGKCVYEICGWDGNTFEFLGRVQNSPSETGPFDEVFEARRPKAESGEPRLKKDNQAFSGPLVWTIPLDSDLVGYVPSDPSPDVVYPQYLECIQTDLASLRVWGFDETGRFYVLQVRDERRLPRTCDVCHSRKCRPFVQIRNTMIVGLRCLKAVSDTALNSKCECCGRVSRGTCAVTVLGPVCTECAESARQLVLSERPGVYHTSGDCQRNKRANWIRPPEKKIVRKDGKSIRDRTRCPTCGEEWTWDDMYVCTVGCSNYACISCWRKSGSRETCPSCGKHPNTCYTIVRRTDFSDA